MLTCSVFCGMITATARCVLRHGCVVVLRLAGHRYTDLRKLRKEIGLEKITINSNGVWRV